VVEPASIALALAERYLGQGLSVAARRVLDEAERVDGDTWPEPMAARVRTAQAAAALASDDPTAALALVREAVRRGGGVPSRLVLAQAQLAARELDGARLTLAQVQTSRGVTVSELARAAALLAQVQRAAGDPSASLQLAEAQRLAAGAAPASDREEPAIYSPTGLDAAISAALDRGDGDVAVDLIRAALRRDPARSAWWRDAAAALAASDLGVAARQQLLDAMLARVGGTEALERLREAAGEVARDEALAGLATHGHRHKNLIGVSAARARSLRRAAERDAADPALVARLVEHERELGALYEAWARTLRSMQLELLAVAEVDVAAWLERLAVGARERHVEQAGFGLEVELAPDLPTLHADARLLGEAIDNLIANAVEAAGAAPLRIMLTASARGNELTLTVRDDGPGLPDGHAPSGRGGATTKPHGSGLGLVIVERVVAAHQGRFVLSSDGAGTLATIQLPVDGVGVRWRRPR
jgi:signal transduction histidine kinase